MIKSLLAAAALIAFTVSAQADIACGLTGCWETGKKIISNGGVYRGLEHKKPDKNGVLRRVYPQSIDAEAAPRVQSDAFVPRVPGN